MTTLLESLLEHLAVLYLNPAYRITDSSSTGSACTNASLRLTGDVLSWRLTTNREQTRLVVGPTKLESAENWFRLTSVRQYLDGTEEDGTLLTDELASWLNSNVARVEELFANDIAAKRSCAGLIAVEEEKAAKTFGPDQG